jgi:hypothetical protein
MVGLPGKKPHLLTDLPALSETITHAYFSHTASTRHLAQAEG